MISELFLRDYFQRLAETHTGIGHMDNRKSFFVLRSLELEEFDQALKNMAGKKGLILHLGDGSFGSSDNVQDKPELTLYFVIHTDGKYEHIDEARQEAKLIAEEFMARIRYDLEPGELRPDNIDGPLRQHNIRFDNAGGYRNLGNIGEDERWTGKMVEFTIWGTGKTSTVYDPAKWNAA